MSKNLGGVEVVKPATGVGRDARRGPAATRGTRWWMPVCMVGTIMLGGCETSLETRISSAVADAKTIGERCTALETEDDQVKIDPKALVANLRSRLTGNPSTSSGGGCPSVVIGGATKLQQLVEANIADDQAALKALDAKLIDTQNAIQVEIRAINLALDTIRDSADLANTCAEPRLCASQVVQKLQAAAGSLQSLRSSLVHIGQLVAGLGDLPELQKLPPSIQTQLKAFVAASQGFAADAIAAIESIQTGALADALANPYYDQVASRSLSAIVKSLGPLEHNLDKLDTATYGSVSLLLIASDNAIQDNLTKVYTSVVSDVASSKEGKAFARAMQRAACRQYNAATQPNDDLLAPYVYRAIIMSDDLKGDPIKTNAILNSCEPVPGDTENIIQTKFDARTSCAALSSTNVEACADKVVAQATGAPPPTAPAKPAASATAIVPAAPESDPLALCDRIARTGTHASCRWTNGHTILEPAVAFGTGKWSNPDVLQVLVNAAAEINATERNFTATVTAFASKETKDCSLGRILRDGIGGFPASVAIQPVAGGATPAIKLTYADKSVFPDQALPSETISCTHGTDTALDGNYVLSWERAAFVADALEHLTRGHVRVTVLSAKGSRYALQGNIADDRKVTIELSMSAK